LSSKISNSIARLLKRDWNFTNESGSNNLFGLHPYPAKFINHIPRSLINDLGVVDEGVILDPFCGSGTTLIEAQSMGYSSIGIDLNPIGCLISTVATTPQPYDLKSSINHCISIAKSINNPVIPNIPNLDHWFNKSVQKGIASILYAINNETSRSTHDILKLALSSVMVRISNQDSDTRYAAVDKCVSSEDVFSLFEKTCNRYLNILPPHNIKLPECSVLCRNILDVKTDEINKPVGLVVCSPPYPNAYEYWLYHKYRMWWLGYDPLYVKSHEIGARPHYFKKNPQTTEDFRDQMSKVFNLLSEVCIDNSFACFVIGDSKIHGQIIDNTNLLIDVATKYNYKTISIINRDISSSRKTFNPVNSRLKNENIIVFQKCVNQKGNNKYVRLNWHPYKYFPYEKKLALRELTGVTDLNYVSINPDCVTVGHSKESVVNFDKLVYFSSFKDDNGVQFHTLQSKLENGLSINNKQKRQSTRYSVHGLHEYKGKFNPQVVRSLLNIFQVNPSDIILDPFCGSGTTLVESSIAGIDCVGWDINPFAVYLSNAKLAALKSNPDVLKDVSKIIIDAYDNKDIPVMSKNPERLEYLSKWFPSDVLNDIESFRNIILRDAPNYNNFFLIILSNLLRDYSLQEPSDLRIRRRKSPMPDVHIRDRFISEIDKNIKLLKHSYDTHGLLDADANAYLLDSRDLESINNTIAYTNKFDFALTSPPYATALPYIDTQRLSMVWLDLIKPSSLKKAEEILIGNRELKNHETKSLLQEINNNELSLPNKHVEFCNLLQKNISNSDGFRRKAVPFLIYRYFSDMFKTFQSIRYFMKPGSKYALLIGTNKTTLGGKEFHIDTPNFLASLAEYAGWSIFELLPFETYKRYGLHSANSIKNETLVVLKNE